MKIPSAEPLPPLSHPNFIFGPRDGSTRPIASIHLEATDLTECERIKIVEVTARSLGLQDLSRQIRGDYSWAWFITTAEESA